MRSFNAVMECASNGRSFQVARALSLPKREDFPPARMKPSTWRTADWDGTRESLLLNFRGELLDLRHLFLQFSRIFDWR